MQATTISDRTSRGSCTFCLRLQHGEWTDPEQVQRSFDLKVEALRGRSSLRSDR